MLFYSFTFLSLDSTIVFLYNSYWEIKMFNNIMKPKLEKDFLHQAFGSQVTVSDRDRIILRSIPVLYVEFSATWDTKMIKKKIF